MKDTEEKLSHLTRESTFNELICAYDNHPLRVGEKEGKPFACCDCGAVTETDPKKIKALQVTKKLTEERMTVKIGPK